MSVRPRLPRRSREDIQYASRANFAVVPDGGASIAATLPAGGAAAAVTQSRVRKTHRWPRRTGRNVWLPDLNNRYEV